MSNAALALIGSALFIFITAGIAEERSPLDDLVITIPKVAEPQQAPPDILDSPEIFESPGITLAPGNTVDVESIMEIEEDQTLAKLKSLAAVNLASNQVYEAARFYWRAARRAGGDQEALAGLAASFLLGEDAVRARTLYEVLVAKYPAEEEYRFNLSSSYYRLGDYKAATGILRKLHKEHPLDAKILYNLALNLLADGEKELGIRYMERSFELLPENPFPLLALARTYSREQDRGNMVKNLEKAAELLSPAELELYLRDPAFERWRGEGLFEKILSGSL